ncbi:MAG: hypothetical protein CFE29_19955 [Bradyrhizobiaceae bacterium PARB1]|jgi:hypothetical protein|nr:MAG: hypothetical protein CFE29_19955 [Bradyrhizobiaceae bacterium PARB1]
MEPVAASRLPQPPQDCRKFWTPSSDIRLPFLWQHCGTGNEWKPLSAIGNLAKAIKRGHSFVAQD